MKTISSFITIVTLLAGSSIARAGDISKTMIASTIADHLKHVDQGMDLITEFSLSPSDVRKVSQEIRGGAYEDFTKPRVKMTDAYTVEITFAENPVKVSFKYLERGELRINDKHVNLKGSKTYANYSAEVDKILHSKLHKANVVTGILAALVSDVGYRMTNSSMRDFGGDKARSAASEEKNLAADIIGFYRADHARCVRSQHDAERQVAEFCSNEKYHPECLASQQQADQNCESRVESYFFRKDSKVVAYGTWSMEKKGFLPLGKLPSAQFAKVALQECCGQAGCYKAVRHDLVDILARAPASEPTPAPPAPGGISLPVPGLLSAPGRKPDAPADSTQSAPVIDREPVASARLLPIRF